jgi:hypothetical protein
LRLSYKRRKPQALETAVLPALIEKYDLDGESERVLQL